MRNCSARRCQMCSAPTAQRIGISMRRIARAVSAAMRIGRRRRRSTHTPAGSASKMNGRKPNTSRSENSIGFTCKPTAANHGIASTETCEPNSLIDWPAQSFRKSACDQSRPLKGLRLLRLPIKRDGTVRCSVDPGCRCEDAVAAVWAVGADRDQLEAVVSGFEGSHRCGVDANNIPAAEVADLVVESDLTGSADDDVGLFLFAVAMRFR